MYFDKANAIQFHEFFFVAVIHFAETFGDTFSRDFLDFRKLGY